MKRFYKKVGVEETEGGFQVALDGRPIKTVKGTPQTAPTRALAEALAREWDAQGEKIDPASLPLRDMTDYAIDIITPAPEAVTSKLIAFADTDTLLYRADPDEPLYTRQQQVWEPIVTAFETAHGVSLKRVSGVIHAAQDEAAMARLKAVMGEMDAFSLAALETLTSLAASLTVGLSALEEGADPLRLWQAASLEEEWQADQWGRDEEAEERRARRTADFERAALFARLARG
ncbi:MAG: ATP12 family protein [Pseudomonadota bacterium]